MKLGIVYTSTTPELIECVNEEIRKNLGDTPEILNYQDPSILGYINWFLTSMAKFGYLCCVFQVFNRNNLWHIRRLL